MNLLIHVKNENSWINFDFVEKDTNEKYANENNNDDENLTIDKNTSTIFFFNRFQIMMLIFSRRTNVEMLNESNAIKSQNVDDDFINDFVEFD